MTSECVWSLNAFCVKAMKSAVSTVKSFEKGHTVDRLGKTCYRYKKNL